MAKDRTRRIRRLFQFRLSSLVWLTLVVAAFISGSLWGDIRFWEDDKPAARLTAGDLLAVEFAAGKVSSLPEGGRFTVEIVDIQKDGSVALRGEKALQTATVDTYYELTGTVPLDRIRPDNSVLSGDVAELRLDQRVLKRF